MRILLVSLCLVTAACGGKSSPTPAAPDTRTLFERLGGQPAINAVVHEFVLATKADDRINQFFTNVDAVKLEQAMDDHVCSITGGGCEYKGKSMLVSHTGMKLSDAHFAAFMDDLAKVLAKLKVPERETKEVLGAFDSLKSEVVGH
ncbi:MAG: group 1 truncated hemoglobin [Kofleriaceae bacterium]